MARRRHFALFFFASLCVLSCRRKTETRPHLTVVDGASWFATTQAEKDFLLQQLPQDKDQTTVDWPPPQYSRTIDVSIDVSGSVFQRIVLYNGQRISLGEYNVHRLVDYLKNILSPSDKVFVRIFGARPGGQSLRVDEFIYLQCPPQKIELSIRRFSRRHDDVEVDAKAQAYPSSPVQAQILQWATAELSKATREREIFQESPLLQHIFHVIQAQSSTTEQRIFIFETDGQFDIGSDLYFSPRSLRSGHVTIDAIQRRVQDLHLKPFAKSDPAVSIVLFGLDYEDDEAFRSKQETLLRWFFEPQGGVKIIY